MGGFTQLKQCVYVVALLFNRHLFHHAAVEDFFEPVDLRWIEIADSDHLVNPLNNGLASIECKLFDDSWTCLVDESNQVHVVPLMQH